jgi:hypothetical protein
MAEISDVTSFNLSNMNNVQKPTANHSNWRQQLFSKNMCSGSIYTSNGEVQVSGRVNGVSAGQKVMLYFWAPAPPTRGISFSGSGMPYPNPLVAYDRTPNQGVVEADGGVFNFRIQYPNAYYIGLGSLYVPPHINFKICRPGDEDTYFTVQIDEGIPFRTLTYPAPPSKNPRSSPMFYSGTFLPDIRTQEAILRASAYPETNNTPDNFWGLRPPR